MPTKSVATPQIANQGAYERRSAVLFAIVPAFGIATISMLPILGALVSPSHNAIYHLAGPASALFVPAFFNLFLLTSVLTVLLAVSRPTRRWGIFIWSSCLFSTLWVLLKNVTAIYQIHMSHTVSISLFCLVLVCIVLSTLAWRPANAHLYRRGLFLASRVLGFAAIFGAIVTVQMGWFFWQARHLNDPATGAASAFGAPFVTSSPVQTAASHPRVIWIVFDEMSQDQAVDSRQAGLQLPNLDSFLSQSTIFTRTIPSGIYTEMVFPALMGAAYGNEIRVSADGRIMQLHQPADASHPASWNIFDQYKTVFAYADSLGYHPGIVGWYNPYCRMLSGVLTSCFWTGESALSSMFPARTISENLFHPTVRLLEDISAFFFPRRLHSANELSAKLHIADYLATSQSADAALLDPTLDFLLLHLPIPHPGGIYDRETGKLTTGKSTYIDNLALVDSYIGHVHDILDRQHAWNDSTILIMGDHSWRTQLLWKYDSNWTPEEQQASHGGKFDDRPFYALKLPNQTTPTRIDKPFHATETQALLDALLARQIKTPVQLAQWTQQSR